MIVHLRLDTGDTILEFSFEWDTAIITTAAAAIFGENIIGMNISEILCMKYVDIQTMLGQDVSPKRQLAACLALLATRNGIHLYLWDEIKDDFSDVLGE